MGILDDAIREHLELKRRHGAESDDLERLENEAFGPPVRPGDPEFPDQPGGEGDDAAPEAEAVAPASDFEAPETSDGPDIPDWLASDEEETRIVPLPAPPSPAEEARLEHPGLGETADHPAPAVEGAPAEAEEEEPPSEHAFPAAPAPDSPTSPEPPEPPEGEIFGADEIDFGDLELDLHEEGAPPPPLPTEPAAEPPLADTPYEEDDELSLELGENETSLAPGPGAVSPSDSEDEEEDLLEETPEFLQDAPEGERLWFEQGAPKDFDFDDD